MYKKEKNLKLKKRNEQLEKNMTIGLLRELGVKILLMKMNNNGI